MPAIKRWNVRALFSRKNLTNIAKVRRFFIIPDLAAFFDIKRSTTTTRQPPPQPKNVSAVAGGGRIMEVVARALEISFIDSA